MLNDGQLRALKLLKTGKNVFLTGEAGTGKSFVLNQFLKEMENENKNILICAPTGIAALNVNGATLHRTFKIPIEPLSPYDRPRKASSVVQKADIIVIDEISMCRFDVFEYVARTIRLAEHERQLKENAKAKKEKRLSEVFQPKQLVVVGDFYQLPPVITDKDRFVLENYWADFMYVGDGFAFQAPMCKEFNFTTILLDEPIRQKDDKEFVNNLNRIRCGDIKAIQWFNNNASEDEVMGINLCPTNRIAEKINALETERIESPATIYKAKIEGVVNATDKPTSDKLELKEGMQVMSLINDAENRYKNGTIGRIYKLRKNSVRVIFNNVEVDIIPHTWEVLDYDLKEDENGNKIIEKIEIGSFTQLPLRIAYAITIHKSQGQTYERANINPACFTAGQLYVALSRVHRIENMHLTSSIKPNYLISSQTVRNFYDSGIRVYDHLDEEKMCSNENRTLKKETCMIEIPVSAREEVMKLLESKEWR